MSKILVIGDVMFDIHMQCNSSRLSPEAPVPVCLLDKSRKILGGAANVAAQIAQASACTLAYIYSKSDITKVDLEHVCALNYIDTLKLETKTHYDIPQKTRIWSNGQQVCRLDKEEEFPAFSSETRLRWLKTIKDFIVDQGTKLIILSDYNKGIFDDDFLQNIIDIANKMGVITILDPKRPTYSTLEGLSITTPNNAEMEKTIMTPEEVSERMVGTYLIHTRGAEGMDCYRNSRKLTHVFAHNVEVSDTCGCGDTVVSFLALALQKVGYQLDQVTIKQAMEAASYAASRTVTHHGSYVLTKEETQAVFGFVR